VVRRRDGRYAISKATRQHTELTKYLTELGAPVPFDAIQLNTGRCGLHVDANNTGLSYLRTSGSTPAASCGWSQARFSSRRSSSTAASRT